MGTHPIFESDFDCLTDVLSIISKLVPELMESERPIEWQVKGIDLDKENRPVYEIEIRRDGIDNNFVPIENFMNRISKQERPRVVFHNGHYFLVALEEGSDNANYVIF